ncbi:NADH-quinone oxidoreductase, chain G [Xylanimonas cellulosilytica DSM 15894]|uniref:NADH-quinone oxidoreductase, chain G n=1 Tax=Xylanimonas cellulosilytica (strain DSM 15894 / JCM 12276 / CECT 5975 / KCTC 9989 / LMG 20990 / NBRC 107835 / XIL07) TaxID=446471 RepID=D1BW11_XYLCX|nr:NADH-quinone oxidoreductase subunit G [Xylanimonas cellulosilytica]ACZ29514.1 NADH-quinone oxidoreductase, chain G [Xylanimonas cellulosilytica DSM 15894]
MTATADKSATGAPAPVETVTLTIDDVQVTVPKGTLVIRAAERVGIEIPRFCDHPLLEPVGACRQCLVEVATPDREGNVRPMPKPQASCTLEATPGMVVRTASTSPVADKAQEGIMEFLLMNHPLDCPVCDKGGECPLQNQAMSNGRPDSRFIDVKRVFRKPLPVSTEILLDRERCVLCQRCTRFSDEIAGDAFIALQERGAHQQIGRFDVDVLGFAHEGVDGEDDGAGTAAEPTTGDAARTPDGTPFASYFSGNTIQICPVGALTNASYRFRARPFDLVSTPGIAEHDSSGAAIRVDHRRGTVMRRLAGDDPVVNEEWITDKDRFAFQWQSAPDRITTPLVREDGELRPASWVEALELAAEGLAAARERGGVGVLPGGRLTVEDAQAWSRFARTVLGSDDVDQRARVHSAEEAAFLAHAVAGTGIGVTFGDLEHAPLVLLAGLEAEEEGGYLFLRLRKAVRTNGLRVLGLAPFASRGLRRLHGTLLASAPGREAEWLGAVAAKAGGGLLPADLPADDARAIADAAAGLSEPGAVILVGERLAGSPGAYTAVQTLAAATGARVAWVPRRAGERGGLDAGLLPGLLPGGRPLTDPAARAEVARAWGVDEATLPATPGRDLTGILAGLEDGSLGGALVGGLELADLPDPAAARRALAAAGFVVSLEVRASEATTFADIVLPVAPPVERAGAWVSWEGRVRAFPQALESAALPDHRVLTALAAQAGVPFDAGVVFPAWTGARADAPASEPADLPRLEPGTVVLASWHLLLDDGALQDGEPHLAGTAKRPVARLSAGTAAAVDVFDGDQVTVSTERGSLTLPVVVTEMVDHVVWLPLASKGCRVHDTLGASPGDVVHIAAATSPDHRGNGGAA